MPTKQDKSEVAVVEPEAQVEAEEPTPAEVVEAKTDEEVEEDVEEIAEVGEPTSATAATAQDPMPALDYDSDETLKASIEALVFAAGEPIGLRDIKRIFIRVWESRDEDWVEARMEAVKDCFEALKKKSEEERGFGLVVVDGGLTFRSNPRFAEVIRAVKEQRPARLSRAALETLSIVAYRQPATKPEIDFIRGVDCGGTIRMLLERNLIRIVGKKDEPGRPLLYGTTKDFLSLFNLGNLKDLPSLHEYNELNKDSLSTLAEFDGVDVEELKQAATPIDEMSLDPLKDLDGAVQSLKKTEEETAEAFAGAGVSIDTEADSVDRALEV